MNSVSSLAAVLGILVELVSLSSVSAGSLSVQWTQLSQSCLFPPSLWCTSQRIAQQCQVESQCQRQTISLDSDDRVRFSLYYEALCPDCQIFVESQLWPTFQRIGSIIDLQLIPYGNAEERKDGDHWKFHCQHGEEECLGNLIETCALHTTKSLNESFPFIACMEMSDQAIRKSAVQCAKEHAIDLSLVMKCVEGPVGNELEHQMALKTDKLDPPHTHVPWVTLNGEYSEDIEQKAHTDLLRLICDTYKGKRVPQACQHSTHVRGCLRHHKNF